MKVDNIKRILFSVTIMIIMGIFPLHAQKAKEVTFKFFGHSCFLITTSQGTRILTDPMKIEGYPIPENLTADIVTVSHNHFDHNYVEAVKGKPRILYGMEGKVGDEKNHKFIPISETIKDVKIFNVFSHHFHPDINPAGNSIFIYEFDGLKVAHLGDIGTVLNADQIKKMGKVDVLMIPVGGKYTMTLSEADSIISQLKPEMIVFPMHYKTDAASFLPVTADDFLNGKMNVERIKGNIYSISVKEVVTEMKYILLNYK